MAILGHGRLSLCSGILPSIADCPQQSRGREAIQLRRLNDDWDGNITDHASPIQDNRLNVEALVGPAWSGQVYLSPNDVKILLRLYNHGSTDICPLWLVFP